MRERKYEGEGERVEEKKEGEKEESEQRKVD